MRMLALTAAIGVGLTVGGIAFAEQWNDPNGRLTFNAPPGWRVQPRNAQGQTAALAFNPTNDCYLFGVSNPNNAGNAAATRNATTSPLVPRLTTETPRQGDSWAAIVR